MKLYWEIVKDWIDARWNARQKLALMTAAYIEQGRRLRGTEDALRRVADSIERDLAHEEAAQISPQQVERLAHLIAECGEFIQMAAKVLNHGWDGCSPFTGKPNRVLMEREAGDVLAAIDRMVCAGELRKVEVSAWRSKRATNEEKWKVS